MIELCFYRDLYSELAVEEAAKAFAAVADIECERSREAIVLRVESRYPRHERRILGQLKNYALARTIDRGGPR